MSKSTQTNSLESLRNERDRFVAFAFASADILIETDEAGEILFADGATHGLLGYKPEQLLHRNFFDLAIADDAATARKLQQNATPRIENLHIHLQSQAREALPFSLSGYRLPYLKNHYFLTLSLLKEHLSPEDMARHDLAAALLDKETFVEAANKRIWEAKESGHDVKLTLLDVPDLKAFLDGLPDAQAAHLMSEITQHLRAKSLGGDTAGIVSDHAYSVMHDASLDVKQMTAEIIHLSKKADPKGQGLAMQAATLDTAPGRLTPQDSASALLYTINAFAEKAGGDFCIDSLAQGYQTMLDETVASIAQFKKTVAETDFQVAFQPIVNLKTGIVHHFETLVRFEGANGFQSPFHFITFGEQAGMIGEFDLAMCQKSLEILDEAAKNNHKPRVAVNLSGKSLSSTLFMDMLRELMKSHPKRRSQVIFEVTESAKISDITAANNFLQEMRGLGNLCCLDDFGVGESSFEYLRHLQVDFIKIDGSYVRESMTSQRGKHMLKAMASLCRNLDIVTIGEMVEDEKCAATLWEAGVKFGQGYLFGKPTVDRATLVHYAKQTPDYKGITRAKKMDSKDRAWWARKE